MSKYSSRRRNIISSTSSLLKSSHLSRLRETKFAKSTLGSTTHHNSGSCTTRGLKKILKMQRWEKLQNTVFFALSAKPLKELKSSIKFVLLASKGTTARVSAKKLIGREGITSNAKCSKRGSKAFLRNDF